MSDAIHSIKNEDDQLTIQDIIIKNRIKERDKKRLEKSVEHETRKQTNLEYKQSLIQIGIATKRLWRKNHIENAFRKFWLNIEGIKPTEQQKCNA